MSFKENEDKEKEMISEPQKLKISGGEKLVDYEGMDAYTEELMGYTNQNFEKIDGKLEQQNNLLMSAIGKLGDKYDKSGGLVSGEVVSELGYSIKPDERYGFYLGMRIVNNNGDGLGSVLFGGDKGQKVSIFKVDLNKEEKIKVTKDETVINAPNLQTDSKEVISAINNLEKNKFDNTGGEINGTTIFKGNFDNIKLKTLSNEKGVIYSSKDKIAFKNISGGNTIELYDNGNTFITAQSLETDSKEVITAINEIKRKTTTILSNAENGFLKLSNGLIIQWGRGAWMRGEISESVTFPIAYPNKCLTVATSSQVEENSQSIGNVNRYIQIKSITKDTFKVISQTDTYGNDIRIRANWIALGY